MTRIVAATMFAMLILFTTAVSAEDVIVGQNNVALRAAPTKNGKIEWRVNEGYRLIVTGRQGNWLQVAAPNLAEPNRDLWVRSKFVTPIEEPAADVASDADFRLELRGAPGARFSSKCVLLEAGDDYRHVQWDHGPVPATVDFQGASVFCSIRKHGSDGRMDAVLWNRDGVAVAAASADEYDRMLEVRSNGFWGSAGGRGGGGQYLAVNEVPYLVSGTSNSASPPPQY